MSIFAANGFSPEKCENLKNIGGLVLSLQEILT